MIAFFSMLLCARESKSKPYVNEEHTMKSSPFSSCAFVTSIHPCDNLESIVRMAQVLGYSLGKQAKEYDRVILLHESLKLSREDLSIFYSVFTHVLFRPDITPNCEYKVEHISLQYQFFKWHSLNLTNYTKILYVSPNTMFVKSPALLFNNIAPFAVPDFQIWNTSIYGAMPNLGFIGVESTDFMLNQIMRTFCNIFQFYSFEIKTKTYENPGDFTFQVYFSGNISMIPYYNNFQIPGPRSDVLNNVSRTHDPRIISVSFQKNYEPWKYDNIYSTLWYKYANKIRKEYLGSNASPMIHNNTQHTKILYKDYIIRSKEEILACSTEFELFNMKRVVINSFLIIIISLSFLGFSITFRKLPYYNWWNVIDFIIEFFTL